ncbi:TRAP transporter small permease [Aestuariirhabdus litorea]|nr:TRAP transporter small permease [Aestuariirhabdus litorea]
MRDIINSLEEGFIRFLLVAMTLLVFFEVVLRFGFNTGIHWAQEVTLLMAAWFVLFGVSYGIKVGAHIGVDAFVKLLPDKPRRYAAILAVLLCLFYCGLFLYGGWVYLAKLKMIGIELEDLPFPKWIATSILFIGFILLAIRFIHLLWNLVTGKADGFKLADEAKESMHLAEELSKEATDSTTHPHKTTAPGEK